ncbi:T-cell surface glycoprotein CD3 zeta chain isoform X4 [Theropithecus gelada]|uniref:T-cell surface glycoprotein CD3 zeta chain isoform X4 n=1 Tax=Theropithecus gelada TaxID=9565 RepID=UPI000DC19194|nr:T-cell surface glycoprotein CD3 zeta chain isoform X4 [Theropithecus gelada]
MKWKELVTAAILQAQFPITDIGSQNSEPELPSSLPLQILFKSGLSPYHSIFNVLSGSLCCEKSKDKVHPFCLCIGCRFTGGHARTSVGENGLEEKANYCPKQPNCSGEKVRRLHCPLCLPVMICATQQLIFRLKEKKINRKL